MGGICIWMLNVVSEKCAVKMPVCLTRLLMKFDLSERESVVFLIFRVRQQNVFERMN